MELIQEPKPVVPGVVIKCQIIKPCKIKEESFFLNH